MEHAIILAGQPRDRPVRQRGEQHEAGDKPETHRHVGEPTYTQSPAVLPAKHGRDAVEQQIQRAVQKRDVRRQGDDNRRQGHHDKRSRHVTAQHSPTARRGALAVVAAPEVGASAVPAHPRRLSPHQHPVIALGTQHRHRQGAECTRDQDDPGPPPPSDVFCHKRADYRAGRRADNQPHCPDGQRAASPAYAKAVRDAAPAERHDGAAADAGQEAKHDERLDGWSERTADVPHAEEDVGAC